MLIAYAKYASEVTINRKTLITIIAIIFCHYQTQTISMTRIILELFLQLILKLKAGQEKLFGHTMSDI